MRLFKSASSDVRRALINACCAWTAIVAAGFGLAYLADIGLRAAAHSLWGIG